MRFHSILRDGPGSGVDGEQPTEPTCLADLNLDQVLESMTPGREQYDLKPFFYAPLHDVAAVRYRHDVLRDLEKKPVFEAVAAFARHMRTMRDYIAQARKLHHRYQQERWYLDAVRYAVRIKGDRVTVSRYGGEADYSGEVAATFARFQQGAVKDYRAKLPNWAEMDSVEARVLDLVARLYPEVFSALDEYLARHRAYLDRTIGVFDREVQFYLAYLDYISRFTSAGLPFCYPQVSTRSKEVYADAAFDLALANRLVPEGSAVVGNDFHLEGPERTVVVTGPNQGGKTTFARMFGQLHYLASLGLPVPASRARLFLPDRVFTHFEREEDLATLHGKLEDDLLRIHDILQQATGDSVVIMNESFTSTTLADALFLGTEVMRRLTRLGSLGVCVTFVDELASLDESTVSMVGTVVPEDPAVRTYRIVRKPADGLAYAWAIAEKYGLTYHRLKERLVS